MDRIAANAFVLLDYVLKAEDGEILDDSSADGGEPIRYVHGYGMLVPGLEKQLVGLGAGEAKAFVGGGVGLRGARQDEAVLPRALDLLLAPAVGKDHHGSARREIGA